MWVDSLSKIKTSSTTSLSCFELNATCRGKSWQTSLACTIKP